MIKKFFKYIGLLLLVVFIADRVLYLGINAVQRSTLRGIQGGKINYYLSLPASPDLLIMGPSNAGYQINPSSFETSAFNLGHPDTKDAFQTALLSIIIENKKIPKNILLHINPDLYLGEDSSKNYTSTNPLKLGFYYSKNKLTTEYINEISFKERIKFIMLLTRYNNKVVSLMKDFVESKVEGPIANGFFPFPAAARDSINVTLGYEAVVKRKLNDKASEKILYIQKSKMKYLSRFIELCRENNINVILFTLPFYADVMKRREVDLSLNNITNFCSSKNILYIDFRQSDLMTIINHPSFWKDMQHLNDKGALLESQFVSGMINPFLRK